MDMQAASFCLAMGPAISAVELAKPLLKYKSIVTSSMTFSKALSGLDPLTVSNGFTVGC